MKSSDKRLIIGTELYLYTSSNAPKGLKHSECKKGNLRVHPSVPYVPPTDLLQTKERLNNLKVNLSNGTIFTMSIFTKGNLEDYLLHVQVVLHLIRQKELEEQCRKLHKELKDTQVP